MNIALRKNFMDIQELIANPPPLTPIYQKQQELYVVPYQSSYKDIYSALPPPPDSRSPSGGDGTGNGKYYYHDNDDDQQPIIGRSVGKVLGRRYQNHNNNNNNTRHHHNHRDHHRRFSTTNSNGSKVKSVEDNFGGHGAVYGHCLSRTMKRCKSDFSNCYSNNLHETIKNDANNDDDDSGRGRTSHTDSKHYDLEPKEVAYKTHRKMKPNKNGKNPETVNAIDGSSIGSSSKDNMHQTNDDHQCLMPARRQKDDGKLMVNNRSTTHTIDAIDAELANIKNTVRNVKQASKSKKF